MEFDRRWLSEEWVDPATAAEVAAMIEEPERFKAAFGSQIDFGTAGMRGVLGPGTACMNRYTVGRAVQGLAKVLLTEEETPKVAIAYDSRHCSTAFAEEAAAVLAANGVTALLYPKLMPTPALSFAVRQLGCSAGIMITASHNPPQYNGLKAYGADGGQLVSEKAEQVQAAIAETDLFTEVRRMEPEAARRQGLVQTIPQEVQRAFCDAVLALRLDETAFAGSELKVVYTPLNGAGLDCVLAVLERAGLDGVTVVPQQRDPDGDFTTCPSPNPESAAALELAIALAKSEEADLVLATDPDCDRVGAAVATTEGWRLITGNEMGALLLEYICTVHRERGTMPEKPVAVRSIVSSPLTDAIAAHYGVEMVQLLTGFKYIGAYLSRLEAHGESRRFLLGFEESYGYLTGSHVRDKDAVNASLLIAEMCAHYKKQGRTLWQVLQELYAAYGCYLDRVESIAFAGSTAMADMAQVMAQLRKAPPAALGGVPIVELRDYAAGIVQTAGEVHPTGLPCSDVLAYRLADGSTVTVRPSGTEPKLKLYYSLRGESHAACQCRLEQLQAQIHGLLGANGEQPF